MSILLAFPAGNDLKNFKSRPTVPDAQHTDGSRLLRVPVIFVGGRLLIFGLTPSIERRMNDAPNPVNVKQKVWRVDPSWNTQRPARCGKPVYTSASGGSF